MKHLRIFKTREEIDEYLDGGNIGSQDLLYAEEDGIVLFSTNNVDGGFEVIETKVNDPYEALMTVGELTHEIFYNDLDYEYAYDYFHQYHPYSPAACSAVVKNGMFGRNYDWYESDDTPVFVMHTPATDDRNAVLGVCVDPLMKEEIAAEHKGSSRWKILPFYMLDGINDKGVYACYNVVPRDKGKNEKVLPVDEQMDEVCFLMLPRFILDHFDTATDAVNHLKEHTLLYFPQSLLNMNYELHLMVGDSNNTYVVEVVNGELNVIEHDVMTNFHISGVDFLDDGTVYTNIDDELPSSIGITDHGSGLERYNLIIESTDSMRDLMNDLMYSNAYDIEKDEEEGIWESDSGWYSEFVYDDLSKEVTVDSPVEDPNLQYMLQYAYEVSEGLRDGLLWTTVHSSVYDIENKTLNLVTYEDMDNEYEFTI